jgi:hypothetical protein
MCVLDILKKVLDVLNNPCFPPQEILINFVFLKSWQHSQDSSPSLKRYPTPGMVRIKRGRSGTGSIF